jgi:hypothetical protein
MNRLFATLAVFVLGLSVSNQTRAESTIEVDPQTLRPVTSSVTLDYALKTGGASLSTAQSRPADNLITPVRRWGYGRPYYGGYYRPYRSSYYGGGWGYPYRSYSYYRPYYNYGYSSYPYYSYGYSSYPRYTTGYRYGINPGVSFYFGW